MMMAGDSEGTDSPTRSGRPGRGGDDAVSPPRLTSWPRCIPFNPRCQNCRAYCRDVSKTIYAHTRADESIYWYCQTCEYLSVMGQLRMER
jgi:hypothetical protein